MIRNQGRWLTVVLYALLGSSGCAEGTQVPTNPLPGAPGSGSAGNAAGTSAAGATSPRAGTGGVSAAGTAGTVAANNGGSAAGAGRGGAGGSAGAGTTKPGARDAGIDDTDADVEDPTTEEWVGTTSQRLDMNFTVTKAGLTQLRLQYAFPPVCTGDNSTPFDPPEPLGDPFSVSFVLAGATNATFSGTFAADGQTASGRVVFMSTLMPGQPACGVGAITWTATRQ